MTPLGARIASIGRPKSKPAAYPQPPNSLTGSGASTRTTRTRPGQVPAGAAPVTGGQASPPSVMAMPLAAVQVGPYRSGYVTLGAHDLTPLYTTDGAAVPSDSPGRWGQVVAAGNPHPQAQRAVRAPIAGGQPQTGAGRRNW